MHGSERSTGFYHNGSNSRPTSDYLQLPRPKASSLTFKIILLHIRKCTSRALRAKIYTSSPRRTELRSCQPSSTGMPFWNSAMIRRSLYYKRKTLGLHFYIYHEHINFAWIISIEMHAHLWFSSTKKSRNAGLALAAESRIAVPRRDSQECQPWRTYVQA